MSDEESLEHEIAGAVEWLNRERPRAGFFAWPERRLAEAGVARTFAEAARSVPGFPLTNVQSARRDPPDCTAQDARGHLVAIEVTELVDGEANALAKRDRSRVVLAAWDAAKLAARLRQLLNAKDKVALLGGPYFEYIVLIHSDEDMLDAGTVEQYLEGATFGPFKQVSRAFLLPSYDPARCGYPYFELYSQCAG